MNVTDYRQLAARTMSEDDLTAQILDLATDLGWTLRHHDPDSRKVDAGFPDWVLANPSQGRVIYAELKNETRKVTPEQQQWLDVLTTAGHETYVWRPRHLLAGEIATAMRGRA